MSKLNPTRWTILREMVRAKAQTEATCVPTNAHGRGRLYAFNEVLELMEKAERAHPNGRKRE